MKRRRFLLALTLLLLVTAYCWCLLCTGPFMVGYAVRRFTRGCRRVIGRVKLHD